MYFLLPAYADSHARLPKSYGGQGFCLWLNALRVSAVVPQHGTKADMLRRPPARVLCTAGRGFVRGGSASGMTPDEESGGAMSLARGAPQILFCIAKNMC